MRLLCIAAFAFSPFTTNAFPIDAAAPPGAPAPQACAAQTLDQAGTRSTFHGNLGSPAHEEMTRASVRLAQEGKTVTRGRPQDLEKLTRVPPRAQRTILACCRYVQGSHYCRCLASDVRNAQFSDPSPIETGSRWPDDPCHMTARVDTFFIPVNWFLGGPRSGNNLFYLSHFHNFAFLHAMAASGDGDTRSVESTTVTRLKILTWMEFALRVADGSIPPGASFRQAQEEISPQRRKIFGQMFPGFLMQPKSWTIGMFFLGMHDADPMHVRQIALGALLHTVQDSFSDSHVHRESRVKLGEAFAVTNVGPIRRFLDYKQQSKLVKHPAGDAPPSDMLIAPTDGAQLHPVSVGAELIACATLSEHRSTSSESWSCAEPHLERLLKLADGHYKGSSGGRYR